MSHLILYVQWIINELDKQNWDKIGEKIIIETEGKEKCMNVTSSSL